MGKVISFTKEFQFQLSLGLAIVIGTGIWTVAIKFHGLKLTMQNRWSYGMERESWYQVRVDNPGFQVPDTDRIREKHQGAAFFDDSRLMPDKNGSLAKSK